MNVTRAEVPFAEVLAAVRAHIGETSGVLEADHQLFTALREALRIDFALTGSAGRLGYQSQQAASRFQGQVSRALNKLAEEGVLRKAGAGMTGPDGREHDRTNVMYYTPEAWAAAEQAAGEEQLIARSLAGLWDGLCARLRALGLEPRQDGRHELSLPLEGWEALLQLAEGGMGWHPASDDA